MKRRTGRPSKKEKKEAQTALAQGVPVETIADRLGRDPDVIATWTPDTAHAEAAAAAGLPPPGSGAGAGPGPGPGPGPGSDAGAPPSGLSAEAVVNCIETTRLAVLETACVLARVDSEHPKVAPLLPLKPSHREVLTSAAPQLAPHLEKLLATSQTAALVIAGGIVVASMLPAVVAILKVGRDQRRERKAGAPKPTPDVPPDAE